LFSSSQVCIFTAMVLRSNMAQTSPTIMVPPTTILPFVGNDLLNTPNTTNADNSVSSFNSGSSRSSDNVFLGRLYSHHDSHHLTIEKAMEEVLVSSSSHQRSSKATPKAQLFTPTTVIRRAFKLNGRKLQLLKTATTTTTSSSDDDVSRTCTRSSSHVPDHHHHHHAPAVQHKAHSHGTATPVQQRQQQPQQEQKQQQQEQKQQQQRRSVQFDVNKTTVHVYDRPIPDNGLIWWTASEILESRAEARGSIERSQSVRAYLDAYHHANRQVCREKRLSGAYLADLTHGLIQGHRGLELFTRAYNVKRRSEISAVVRSVIAAHQQATRTAATGAAASTSAATRSNRHNDVSRQVRAHSSALTQNSRHWAHAMGRADRNAIRFDKSDSRRSY
jgi:hypothetical protein